jgi:hypothetical protein
MTRSTKFFFIDEQGSFGGKEDWLLRGGFLINVEDYLKLNNQIKSLNNRLFGQSREVKWSHIQSAIYLKTNDKPLGREIFYLNSFSINDLNNYLNSFFKIVSDIDIKIIINLSVRSELVRDIKKQESFIKMQLQNLMQRCQFAGQEEGFISILVHENENTSKDDKIKKEVYREIINNDSFVKDYNLIVDNLFIEFSNLNIGIQVADFIIGAIGGTLRNYETSTRIYTQHLKSKVRRNPKDGSSVGWGILPLPNKNRNPEFSSFISKIFD